MRPSEPMDTMTPHAAVQILQKLRSSCGSLMLAMAPALLLPSVEVTHNYYPYRRSESWDFFPSHSAAWDWPRSEEHTSELQSLMRISYAVFCLKKKKHNNRMNSHIYHKH